MNDDKKNTSNRLIKSISWIFFGNVAHAILNFILGVYVARKLSLSDNGMLNYATSWIAFFTALSCFGFSSTITKHISREKEKTGEFLCTGIVARVEAGLCSMVMLQIIVRNLAPNETYLHLIVLCQSSVMLFSGFDLILYWFRYQNRADLVAIMRMLAFGVSVVWRIAVLYFNGSLVLYVVGTVAETAIFVLLLCFFLKKEFKGKYVFAKDTLKQMLKESYPFIYSAILTTVYAQTDKIMLKSMMDNSAVALYSAAAQLAIAISMIPSALIEGFRADIMEYSHTNRTLFRKRLCQLYSVVFWISAAYCVFVMIFAKQIMLILYGQKYVAAGSALALVVWYSTFSYFGSINNLYMVAEGKSKWVQYTTISGAAANIVLNYLLIPRYGINGAAVASLATQFLANFVMLYLIKDLRPALRILMDGIALKNIDIKEIIRRLKK